MKRVSLIPQLAAAVMLLVWIAWPAPAKADSGHARIVRLSLVQGDVRYTPQFHKDSIGDSKAVWQPAPLNLPIRDGFALSTGDDSRAEVEFENGAMAFLSANTLIEFYDLSLDDGALITRLILRQGSAIFYVNPAKFDFFSVTGGDFSIEANGRSRFRLDNYDDGSTVGVEQGHVSVLRNNETKPLAKGQSYSVSVEDPQNPVIARAADYDDFDKWVSGRIDAVATATTYSQQYVNSPSYSSGFSDLYNYGGWYNVAGYGYCWQPYGVGFGWNPFAFGSWGFDPVFGWNFIGSAPWGWLPYHYGGWIFSPGMGWVWAPTGFGLGGPVVYRPVTGIFVHSGGALGIVPLHPIDGHGKTPLNLSQGVYAVHGNTVAATITPSTGEKWSVTNHLSRQALSAPAATPAPAPTRVSRTILAGNTGARAVTLSRNSSIVYDPATRGFVNSSDPAKSPAQELKNDAAQNEAHRQAAANAHVPSREVAKGNASAVARGNAPRPNIAPPHVPATDHSAAHASGGGAVWGGGSHSGGSGSSASSGHSSSGGGGGSGGHSSGGGGGGGGGGHR